MTLAFRSAKISDRDWLYDLHRRALSPYVEQIWGWNEDWQSSHFDEEFTPERIQIVSSGEVAVGMVQWEDRPDVLYLGQLEVLPEYQSRGIGREIVQELQARAAEGGKGVALQVFKINTGARRLYERLGFRITGETERHFEMIWSPGPTNREATEGSA